MRDVLIWGAVALAIALLLQGCSLYNHAFRTPGAGDHGGKFDLQIVQLDDFGSFWDADGARTLLASIERQSLSMTSNTYVFVFVHGWHNNAAPDNDNLREFTGWLDGLSARLSEPQRRATREELTGTADFKLIGIYVGWRGRSLPGILDYATMWWRKAAAERVGEGDLSEFLERLQRIYLRANAYGRYIQNPRRTPLTGLVTIGHSFGGQAVLKAVSRSLESELTMRAPCLTDAVVPPATPADRPPERVPIDSFGDLNILLNPATEAYQFGRIDALYRQLAYPVTQTPQLVVFSADNDSAREFFFPIARGITRPFRPSFRTAYQGTLFGQALGEVAAQQTHELRLAPGLPDALVDSDFAPDRRHVVADYDFTSATVFAGARLDRMTGKDPTPNSPVEVIYARDKIIDGHNGIFQRQFQDFLTGYITFIEGKRVVLRYQGFEELRLRGAAAATPDRTMGGCPSPAKP